MVERLRNSPDWLPEERPIEMVQTQISVVLLGRQHVLKLKKPISFGEIDYTTVEQRRRACEAEVMLNRRLCPDIYLGVQPISAAGSEVHLSGEGEIIDYGVVMRRLPTERMLNRLIRRNAVTEAIIDAVAERLSLFHRRADHSPRVSGLGALEEIRRSWAENFEQTEGYIERTIDRCDFESIRAWTDGWMRRNEDLFARRVSEGRIRDGHGDLRAESICVTPTGIVIFDCAEFNDRMRACDVANEVAMLAVDLDALGRPDLGYYFAERYQARSADPHLFKLLPFYRCYRAYDRGRMAGFDFDDPELLPREQEAARDRARDYFELARRYSSPLGQPTVIAIAGLPGTGKTSLARAIAGELGWRVVSADAVRQSLFGAIKQAADYGGSLYSREANLLTYESMLRLSREWLSLNGGVVIDATFRRAEERERARAMAEAAGANWRLIECRLQPGLVRSRLANGSALDESLAQTRWEIYTRQAEEFEPIAPERQHLVLNTEKPLSSIARSATDWLRQIDV